MGGWALNVRLAARVLVHSRFNGGGKFRQVVELCALQGVARGRLGLLEAAGGRVCGCQRIEQPRTGMFEALGRVLGLANRSSPVA